MGTEPSKVRLGNYLPQLAVPLGPSLGSFDNMRATSENTRAERGWVNADVGL
jgi:hypothetical protein